MIRTWHQPTTIVALLAACTWQYLASPVKAEECSDPCTVTATVPDIHLVDTTSAGTSDDWEIRTEAGLLRMGQLAGNQQLFTLDIGAPANTLHVDAGGRVGIGTAVPAADLQINGTFPKILLDDISSGAGKAELVLDNDRFTLRGTASSIVAIDTRSSLALTIDDLGNVGVGLVPDPLLVKLHVGGSARMDGGLVVLGDVALGSSRTLKTAFDAVDPGEVLAKLADLPVASWRYKTEDEAKRHIGPFAEDFQRLFGLGDGETISVIDAQGVALAAIQGLKESLDARDAQLAAVHAQNDELTATLTTLRTADADRERELARLRTDLELLKAALASR